MDTTRRSRPRHASVDPITDPMALLAYKASERLANQHLPFGPHAPRQGLPEMPRRMWHSLAALVRRLP
ncbi:MAG TPA: hypothetical protein VM287_10665 [Egibacteraceae bacterium]|nr:hypothetical protein [Egibacteraceae bacterium]